ncbi:MAG: SCO family protein [Bacteroidota bacterium]
MKKQHSCKRRLPGVLPLRDNFSDMSKKGWFYTGFFVALVLIFYFILTQVIPGFGQKKANPVSTVQHFSFINQDGKQVTEKDMTGKVYVAEYFFTTCKGICPKMNNNMKIVYEELKNEKDFLILSHTCDPDIDSVGQMKKYADSLGVDTRKWIFLTGGKKELYDAARISYTIDDPANNLKSIDDDFLHTQFWALVDRNGEVRKIYDGLKESEVKGLIKNARKLLK